MSKNNPMTRLSDAELAELSDGPTLPQVRWRKTSKDGRVDLNTNEPIILAEDEVATLSFRFGILGQLPVGQLVRIGKILSASPALLANLIEARERVKALEARVRELDFALTSMCYHWDQNLNNMDGDAGNARQTARKLLSQEVTK